MLIIGHRGAAGLAPENTIDAMAAGVAAGADMLELDVRLTRDGGPVVAHDNRLLRTHHRNESISHLTYTELQALTSEQPVSSLAAVLDRFLGVVILNIELKGHGSAEPTYQLLTRYITSPDDWDMYYSRHSPYASFGNFGSLRLRPISLYFTAIIPLHSWLISASSTSPQ